MPSLVYISYSGQYWLSPGEGMVKTKKLAHKYTRKEALEVMGPGCRLVPIPVKSKPKKQELAQ
jgi:hypothetical protein